MSDESDDCAVMTISVGYLVMNTLVSTVPVMPNTLSTIDPLVTQPDVVSFIQAPKLSTPLPLTICRTIELSTTFVDFYIVADNV